MSIWLFCEMAFLYAVIKSSSKKCACHVVISHSCTEANVSYLVLFKGAYDTRQSCLRQSSQTCPFNETQWMDWLCGPAVTLHVCFTPPSGSSRSGHLTPVSMPHQCQWVQWQDRDQGQVCGQAVCRLRFYTALCFAIIYNLKNFFIFNLRCFICVIHCQ